MYTFSESVSSLIPGSQGRWLEVADEAQLSQAVDNLDQLIPDGGTNLAALFQSIQGLSPLPDNIFLITDGLPTRDNREPRTATISGRDRERLFEQALEYLPSGIPVNVILAPLEGDHTGSVLLLAAGYCNGRRFYEPLR